MSNRLEQLQKLVAVSPDDPLSHYGVGLELVNLERWEDAAAAFGATLQVDPNYVAAYYHKGRAEIQAGQATTAQETLNAGEQLAVKLGDDKTAGEIRELKELIP